MRRTLRYGKRHGWSVSLQIKCTLLPGGSLNTTDLVLRLSSHHGVPSTLQIDHSILSLVGSPPGWVPPLLVHNLNIAYHNHQACNILGNYDGARTGLHPHPASMIPMFDQSFRALELQMGSEWSPSTERTFLRARLQLYSFALTAISESRSTNASSQAPWISEILAQAYLSASKLIESACSSVADMPFWAADDKKSVSYAVFFLLKLLALTEHHVLDYNATRNSINQAWDLLHGNSESRHDSLSRVCAIIEYLSRNEKVLAEHSSSMIVRSRMAANLVLDAVWRAKGRFSQRIRDSRPLDYTSAAQIEGSSSGEEPQGSHQVELDFQFISSYLEGDPSALDFSFAGF